MTQDATATEEKSSRSYWGFVLWPVLALLLKCLFVTALPITLGGCSTVRDNRGASSVCLVHHTEMRTVTERAPGAGLDPTMEYAEARMKLFPHAGGEYIPSPYPWKREMVYICDECIRAKEEWWKNH